MPKLRTLPLTLLITVLAIVANMALSDETFAKQGRGRGRFNDKKAEKFINGHDARDGRWDGRGPRDRFGDRRFRDGGFRFGDRRFRDGGFRFRDRRDRDEWRDRFRDRRNRDEWRDRFRDRRHRDEWRDRRRDDDWRRRGRRRF
jgi:hypothetical protein